MHKNTGTILIFVFIFILNFSTGFSQTKSNLEIFYSMVDSSGSVLINNLPNGEKSISVEFNSGNNYLALENRLIEYLIRKGIKISGKTDGEAVLVRYVFDRVNLRYNEMYRDGFLGSYYVPRNFELSGNFFINKSTAEVKNFTYTYSDTVKYDSLRNAENTALPFTRGDIPPEPFFSSLIEPVVAVGAAAAAVALFFTVRSK